MEIKNVNVKISLIYIFSLFFWFQFYHVHDFTRIAASGDAANLVKHRIFNTNL